MADVFGSPRSFGGSARSRRSGTSGLSGSSALALLGSFDALLVTLVVALSSFGVLMITSATRDTQRAAALDPYLYLKKQVVYVCLGLLAMVVVTLIDYRTLLDLSPAMYGVSMLMLIGVLFTPKIKGVHAWFELGQFQLQPSEFTKLVLILALAAYGGAQRNQLDGRRVGTIVAVAAAPIFLVFLEPDLGGALVFGVILLTMLWVAGADSRHMRWLFLAGATFALITVKAHVLADYQIKRLTSFVGQPVYNVQQSKVSIGSGGLTGRGLFAGAQTRYGYVPERHTDFIFSVVGEQLGLIGAGLLLLLLALLCWRMLRIAMAARDMSGTLICVGVLALFMFQVFENVGMTMQIMPVTGIPLPLVSYGGSSTIMEFMAIGLVLNVNRHRFR
jgi:rod shape determining protein RodA